MNIRRFFTKKKVTWYVIIVLVAAPIAYHFFKGNGSSDKIQTDTVKKQNLKETVLTTGQVVSGTNLDLSFKTSGIVTTVSVAAGDKVKSGQTVAILDQTSALAGLTTAEGALAQAKASYEKVLAGSSNEQIAVAQQSVEAAQVAVDNASATLAVTKSQQAIAVQNAYATLLNTSITALAGAGNVSNATVTISGTYIGTDQGVYNLSVFNTGSGFQFQTQGLETAHGLVKSQPVPMGSEGLYIQFSGTPAVGDIWTINIPNTYAASYIVNYNAYQAALQAQSQAVTAAQAQLNTAQASLSQAQANLNLQLAQARPADIAAAQAQILSAQGQVQTAQAAVDATLIRAPADGTITQVDIKVGEQATAMAEVMILQDIGNLHAEANVSEANIATLSPGQSVDFTFDALGPDRHFSGTVLTINPASTVISGVVDYLVKASLPDIFDIKPGMTANMTILVAQKDNALAIPQQAVIDRDGKEYVRVIDDPKKLTYHEVEVQTGLQADGGLAEVVSGLSEGQEVITYIKQ